jgi:hypothetical protein
MNDDHENGREGIALLIAMAAAALMFTARHVDEAKALLGPRARATVEAVEDVREAESATSETVDRVQAFTQPEEEEPGTD